MARITVTRTWSTERRGRNKVAELFYENGFAALQALRIEVDDDALLGNVLSEADTRAKIITRVLRDALGWPEKCIVRELHSQSGYADYILSAPHKTMVVEAKRAGRHFLFPITSKNRRPTIASLRGEKDNVGKAIRQARAYADDHGIEYACATNGSQWIAFKAITRGTPWDQGRGIVFRSLSDIEEQLHRVLERVLVRSGRRRSPLDCTFR